MNKFFILFFYCLFIFLPSRPQTPVNSQQQKTDSLVRAARSDSQLGPAIHIDSAAIRLADSLAQQRLQTAKKERVESFQQILRTHAYLPFDEPAAQPNLYLRDQSENEPLFYFLVILLLYFACIKFFFSKYLDNLITLFFRATMRQQQIREQLLQTPLPSLLLNILFVIASGLYLALLARYHQFTLFGNFWITLLYSIGFVAGIYLGKYIVLKVTGWIFNIGSATDTYIFIVFLVNKMIGMFLLPFVIFMAFPNQILMPVVIPISYMMLILLLGYRFLNSYRPIRSEIKVSRLHFFLYLCAFEIAPLLLIYKVLLAFVERSN